MSVILVLIIYLVVVAAGAILYRLRGMGVPGGRIVCGAFVALPVIVPAGQSLAPLDIAMAALATIYTVWALYQAHGEWLNIGSVSDLMAMSGTGVWITMGVAAVAFYYFHNANAPLLLYVGLAKGPCYLLPMTGWQRNKYLWKELAFGSCLGAGVALTMTTF